MSGVMLGIHRLGVRLETTVTPKASKNTIAGVRNGRLNVKVTAPPVDNAANAAVIEIVSKAMGLPRRGVAIVAGEHSRSKSLALSGITTEEVRRRLSVILGHSV